MFYKEYNTEDKKSVDIEKLKAEFMSNASYSNAHSHLPIICADVLIRFNEGFLLVKRENYPVKDEIWCVGGRVLRGVSTIDSIKRIAKRECGIDIENLNLIGIARLFLQTDPFNHGKGVDTPTFMFTGDGKGTIKIDNLHSSPMILKKENYTKKFRNGLHPYMKDFLDLAFRGLSTI